MQQVKTRKKITISFECLVANSFVLMALLLMLAGCVAEEPRSYYRAYPDDYKYYGYEDPYATHTTVIVHENEDDDQNNYGRHHADPDDHWHYGRRGNGNFHGTDHDDVNDD